MRFLIYFFVFSFGLIIGSFLNCIIYRLFKKESFLTKRSYCPYCKHTLSWQDLIPILSFLFLRGRCRYCEKPISFQYPLVEFFTGFLFLLVILQNIDYLVFEPSVFGFLNILFLFFISSILIIIFTYDLKHFIIPDRIIYPAILVSGIWHLVSGIFFSSYTKCYRPNTVNCEAITKSTAAGFLYSALGAAAFFLVIVLLSRGKGMGMGDVKLAFFMGLLLGFPDILVALFLSFILGAVIGIILIIAGRKSFKSEVPFAPFLVTGTFLSLFFGDKIIDFYFYFLI